MTLHWRCGNPALNGTVVDISDVGNIRPMHVNDGVARRDETKPGCCELFTLLRQRAVAIACRDQRRDAPRNCIFVFGGAGIDGGGGGGGGRRTPLSRAWRRSGDGRRGDERKKENAIDDYGMRCPARNSRARRTKRLKWTSARCTERRPLATLISETDIATTLDKKTQHVI